MLSRPVKIVSASTLERLRRRGAGAEVVMGMAGATGSGRGGGDSEGTPLLLEAIV